MAHYFERREFPSILEQAIIEVQKYLDKEGMLHIPPQTVWSHVEEENYESSDYRVRPLEERLTRIFHLDGSSQTRNIVMTLCQYFMKPIFARGRRYEDVIPTLEELKSKGFKTAIVSNTTWGSPAGLWREEIKRLGLSTYFDVAVFCRDAGWRKPARQIFEFALSQLQVSAQHCAFVGDDPRWDIVGPKAAGMETILIDRLGVMQHMEDETKTIRSLNELQTNL